MMTITKAESTMFENMEALEAMFAENIDSAVDALTNTSNGGVVPNQMPVMTSLPCATVTGAIGC